MAKEIIEKDEYQEVLSFDGKYKKMTKGDEIKLRKGFYIFSGSLARYIIEGYGKEHFMDMYRNSADDYFTTEEGSNFFDEWKRFIENSESKNQETLV